MDSLQIKTRSLIIRKFKLDDAKKIYLMSQENGIRTWIPDQVYADESKASDVLQFLIAQYSSSSSPKETPIVLGICLAETGELIGHIGLSPLQDKVEIGYAIEEKHQSCGYATEVVTFISEWGLKSFNLQSVYGFVDRENVASCKVLERSGFIPDDKLKLFPERSLLSYIKV